MIKGNKEVSEKLSQHCIVAFFYSLNIFYALLKIKKNIFLNKMKQFLKLASIDAFLTDTIVLLI